MKSDNSPTKTSVFLDQISQKDRVKLAILICQTRSRSMQRADKPKDISELGPKAETASSGKYRQASSFASQQQISKSGQTDKTARGF